MNNFLTLLKYLSLFIAILLVKQQAFATSAIVERSSECAARPTSSVGSAHVALASDMNNILSNITKKAWTIPSECTPPELTDDFMLFKDQPNKCSFYSCANKSIEQAGICKSDDKTSYFMNYGEKYCNRFGNQTVNKLSNKGKIWLNKTLVCLQKSIIYFCQEKGNCDKCDKVRKLAYATHAPCYTASGLCYLNPIDG